MKRFPLLPLLIFAVFATIFTLNSCEKEVAQDALKATKDKTAVTDRAPNQIIYGATLYDGVTPCEIIGMDENTGLVISNVPAFYIDQFGVQIDLDNIKGICLTSWGGYCLTTGNPANPGLPPGSPYNNALFKVDPVTGQAGLISTSPIGTVSDLEHDPASGNFYGLRNNTNGIFEIVDNANNFGTYNGPVPVTGIAPGYRLKGLSLVRDMNGMYFVGCATTNNPADLAKLYKIDVITGTSGLITDLAPANELGAGHCAIGFDRNLGRMLVNRSNVAAPFLGVNIFGWPPAAVITNTFFWGGNGYDFEDFTSSVY